jgi:hypothetical protein
VLLSRIYMKMLFKMTLRSLLLFISLATLFSCSKKEPGTPTPVRLKADFTYIINNDGQLPATVLFSNLSANANSCQWTFGNGAFSTNKNESTSYSTPGTFRVRLEVTNGDKKDSIEKDVFISAVKYKVRIFLVTPQGETLNPDYVAAIKMCALNLQSWYKTQMDGKTFTLTDAVVQTVQGQHNYTWYNQNNGSISGTDPRFYGWYNTLNDIKGIIGSEFDSPYFINVVYVAAYFEGSGAAGYTALGDPDLKGLLGESSEPVNRWIGGSGHEWGHAFGLPHPPNADNSLMWTGYTIYPNSFLRQDDKDKLNASKFFNIF